MRILIRFSLKSVLATFLTALLIFSFLVMAVETFMHLDSFMTSELNIFDMARYSFLALSKYFMMLISISLLFSITYFLSSLSANNELIALYNAGLSKKRILLPLFILSLFFTAFFFLFNESAGLIWKTNAEIVSQEYFGLSGTQDARKVTLSDENSGYLVYADRYSESYHRLYNPLIIKSKGNDILKRIEGEYADYSDGKWTFYRVNVVEVDESNRIRSSSYDEYAEEGFNFEDDLFRSQNLSIETMQRATAKEYLKRLKGVNQIAFEEAATDYVSRLGEPIGILVLSIISMMMNYSYKKNVLLFSIVQSLSIAVVYYVAEMVFTIASRQGAISYYTLIYLPTLITIILSYVVSLLAKRI